MTLQCARRTWNFGRNHSQPLPFRVREHFDFIEKVKSHRVLSRFLRNPLDGDARETERGKRSDRENEGGSSLLYEFNPALSRHRLLFQPRGGEHDGGTAPRRVDIRGEFCSANVLQGTDPAVARASDLSPRAVRLPF